MDKRVMRLRHMGVAPEVAQNLVDAGIDTPRKVKTAKAADLKAVKVDKDAKVKEWRA